MESNPQPMLTSKMTGLDLGPGPAAAQNMTAPRSHLHSPRTLKELKSKAWSPNMVLSPTPKSTSSDTSFPSTLTPSPRPGGAINRKLSPDGMRSDSKRESTDDVLTTPVITVPRCGDAWNNLRQGKSPMGGMDGLDGTPGCSNVDDMFNPKGYEGLDQSPEIVGPRDPPKDLPMDSDIGLKSPHDGLLAKRRTFAKMKKTPSMTSENSTYSCDTPTTCESSPTQIAPTLLSGSQAGTTFQGNATVAHATAQSDGEFHLKQTPVSNPSRSPTTLKAKIQAEFGSSFIPTTSSNVVGSSGGSSSPKSDQARNKEGVGESMRQCEDGNFKHPNKPDGLKLGPGYQGSSQGGEALLPSCYAQSPLKSPNWNAISQNFGSGDMWKTPKILDNTVFDFLPPPSTPRGSAKVGSPCFRDHSPGNNELSDLNRLSQLSPRFLIPEAPTDLSNNSSSKTNGGSSSSSGGGSSVDMGYGEEKAQDLSMAKVSQEEEGDRDQDVAMTSCTTPAVIPLSHAPPTTQMSPLNAMARNIKQEPIPLPTVNVSQYQSPPTEYNSGHHNEASHPPLGDQMNGLNKGDRTSPFDHVKVKSEPGNSGMEDYQSSGQNQFYAAVRHQQQQAQAAVVANAMVGFPNLYLQSFYSNINRHVYSGGANQDMQRSSPPTAATPPTNVVAQRGSPPVGHGPNNMSLPAFGNGLVSRPQHSISPYNGSNWSSSNPSPGPPPQPGGHPNSGDHHWSQRAHEEGESSISPPHPFGHKTSPDIPLIPQFNMGLPGQHQQGKKRGRKPGGEMATDSSQDDKKKSACGRKGKKGAKQVEGGTKRVYSCPHCQRSYDWNYNLNRHLKYECGKENAFRCSKCGRRFPHKQNCVYHLKRKHKIVCENIDQYVTAGLVVFHGSGTPGDVNPDIKQEVAN